MHCFQLFAMCLTLWGSIVLALPVQEDATLTANFFQGDMLLSPEQLEHLTTGGKGAGKARNALLWSRYYWPDSTIYYSIADNISSDDVKRIEQALALIAARSCVRFLRTSDPKKAQVAIQQQGSGCWSYLGYVGKPQALNLAKGCMSTGTIQHEMLHACGFVHMQSDSTRDSYISVIYENIMPGRENNFNIYAANDVGDFGVGYDYGSVLHYGPTAFSSNGRATIVPLEKNVVIGQRRGMSVKDYEKLNRVYCGGK